MAIISHLILLSLAVYASSYADIMDGKESPTAENQFDISPQSMSVDTIGRLGENNDIYASATINDDSYRYPLTAYRSPGYPMMSPYYGSIPYLNRMNTPFNRFGYQQFNRYPFVGQAGMYPQFNQNQWRSAYNPLATNSDIQFSYLMTHPQAAMTYQNLAYN
ncbi:hypothetical protein RB195_011648 [Necator americanus]|uniref:Uncharacterized protein n=1 Tax=Necator americanus TaxID=51031 RepID=A0ABR1D5C8_NECAM